MVEIKTRNILFDNIKAFVIFTVVLGHAFAWYTQTSGVMSFIHDLVYQFHMPMFIFVSGFFSKDIARSRNRIISDLLIPYIIFDSLYMILLYFATGQEKFDILTPLFSFWYLVSLAFYRGLLSQLIKIKWIIPIAIVIGLAIGLNDRVDTFLSLSRTISFCWFFLAGYYCTEEIIYKIRKFNKFAIITLCISGLAVFAVLHETKAVPLEITMMAPYSPDNLLLGIIGRSITYILASIFGLCIIAFTPSKNNYISIIGQRSMIIYLGHGFINGIVRLTNPFVSLPTVNTIFLFAFSIFVTWFLSFAFFERFYGRFMNIINSFLIRIFVWHKEEIYTEPH